VFAGFHYAELQWRDATGSWLSFRPRMHCWAAADDGIRAGGRYAVGFLVSIEDWSGLDLPVFTVIA
jgi:hypothetical protein